MTTVIRAALNVQRPWPRAEDERDDDVASDVHEVLSATRAVLLHALTLRSDRAPAVIVVGMSSRDYPMTHHRPAERGEAYVTLAAHGAYWAQIAYQFGHELAHVLSNSWAAGAARGLPVRWVEELIAEAMALHGLMQLATAWRERPLFRNSSYAASIDEYRAQAIRAACGDPGAYYREHAAAFAAAKHLIPEHKPLVAWLTARFDADRTLIEDVAARNRWPAERDVDVMAHLEAWRISCAEVGCPGALPRLLQAVVGKA